MIFARERAEVIADKLKKLMVVRKFELDTGTGRTAITGFGPYLLFRRSMAEKAYGFGSGLRLRSGTTPRIRSFWYLSTERRFREPI